MGREPKRGLLLYRNGQAMVTRVDPGGAPIWAGQPLPRDPAAAALPTAAQAAGDLAADGPAGSGSECRPCDVQGGETP